MGKQIRIGWAQTDITPDRPVFLMGQMYYRVSQYVHDPITATAVVLENGAEQAIFVSMDMVGVPKGIVEKVREAVDGNDGIDAGKISFSVTHTHNATRFDEDGHRKEFEELLGEDRILEMDVPGNILKGEEACAFLQEKLVAVIEDAWAARVPGGISYAVDYAAVAFNRRPRFDVGDGTTESKMYGACSQDNFIGMEGPSDHTADLLYTWDLDGNLTGVLVDIPCPSQVMELHYFISADYWTSARDQLREALGNVFVLPLCGAAGDQNPLDLIRLSKTNVEALRLWNAQAGEVFRNFDLWQECEDIGSRIAAAAVRGYRKARNRIETRPVLRHAVMEMALPIRQVSQADYEEASAMLEQGREKFSEKSRMTSSDMVKMFEPVGVVKRWELQQKQKEYCFDVHVIRIGKVAIATNPFELFVEYGMRIKARCKAEQAFLVQLANDVGGYLPTKAALNGGSYSSKPASTVCGPDGGDELVEETIKAINSLWK